MSGIRAHALHALPEGNERYIVARRGKHGPRAAPLPSQSYLGAHAQVLRKSAQLRKPKAATAAALVPGKRGLRSLGGPPRPPTHPPTHPPSGGSARPLLQLHQNWRIPCRSWIAVRFACMCWLVAMAMASTPDAGGRRVCAGVRRCKCREAIL